MMKKIAGIVMLVVLMGAIVIFLVHYSTQDITSGHDFTYEIDTGNKAYYFISEE